MVTITVDLPPELSDALRAIAAERGLRVDETVQIAVEALVRRRDLVDSLSKRIVDEDAELLRRLA